MKLPEEFAGEYDLKGMGHVQRLAETIVRDCAKVAEKQTMYTNMQTKDHYKLAAKCAQAILRRYGLE